MMAYFELQNALRKPMGDITNALSILYTVISCEMLVR